MKARNMLVTGGCGFLGQYLTRDLLKEFPNARVKLLDLKPCRDPLFDFSKNPRVKTVIGKDICNYASIKDEFKGVDVVIHLAGIVSFSIKDRDLMQKVHVNGTRAVLRAAQKNKARLFLHTSSVAAIGYNDKKNSPVDEHYKFDWKIARSRKKYYMLTKHLANLQVAKAQKKGLNTIVIHPGLMFGPGDRINTAELVNAIKKRKIPFTMPGGTNIVDVRDVSRGIVVALKKGKPGEQYLLSGNNLPYDEINKTTASILGVAPPALAMPKFLNIPLYYVVLAVESLRSKRLVLTADKLDSSFKFRYFDNSKAKCELAWEPRISFAQTIKDTVKWMRTNGILER